MFKVFEKFFKREQETNNLISVDNIFVVKTKITSNYDDGAGLGPRAAVTMYFLATQKENKYYEFFSGADLVLWKDAHKGGMIFASFNTPYVMEIKYFKDFLTKKSTKTVSKNDLFYFITNLNTLEILHVARF